MRSLAEALRRSLDRATQQGEALCLSLGHAARSQKLPPAALIRFLIAAEGGSLAKELHRAKIDATPAAITQRRAQIPPEVFREVFTRFNASSVYGRPQSGYKGYRVLAGDGTAINMARNPNAPSYVCNNRAPQTVITNYTSTRFSTSTSALSLTLLSSPPPRKTSRAHWFKCSSATPLTVRRLSFLTVDMRATMS